MFASLRTCRPLFPQQLLYRGPCIEYAAARPNVHYVLWLWTGIEMGDAWCHTKEVMVVNSVVLQRMNNYTQSIYII